MQYRLTTGGGPLGNLRMATHGGLYARESENDGKKVNVQVAGRIILNTSGQLLIAALEGPALTYAPEDVIQPHVEAGRLVCVLEDWCPTFLGYHLYYPSRRQALPASALVVAALRLHN
ncbi:MAG: hypothetical protein EOP13_10255 [Pseudomonas sp.]|uniref:LysR substrate-binding domain-containing protein n=1 Tax=Pseudomonas sp. TaxID=306 RepID=UPI0011F88C1E|nr:LysR substrate-binding domain-containing protein [Pseudomonas sp.]RZI73933.1 MAG: hypothetical protein EOP13_10255 [Pseudomonas sp.]